MKTLKPILENNINIFKKEAVVPFWMWNDKLDVNKLKKQLVEIKTKGINQVIIHPRWGLPKKYYLSKEWFKVVSNILNFARKNNIGIWIYDELNWPSGTAGGKILDNHPNSNFILLSKS
jgi:hypothetical protein